MESTNPDVTVVNVVGAGKFGVEVDIPTLAADLPEAEYDPDTYHGMYLRFDDSAPLVTIYRSGKYIIVGANSSEELFQIRERTLNRLYEVGLLSTSSDSNFAIQNFVCKGEIGQEINLNAAAIGLGLEHTEYEPEQFPGIVYRPPDTDCVMLIFSSGKIIIVGASNLKNAQHAFKDLQYQLDILDPDAV